MTLTDKQLKDLIAGKAKSPIYDVAVEQYTRARIHANGEYPEKLVQERRPHESKYHHEYRKKIYQPITKETVSSVIQSLGKIRRSTDWSIKYDATAVPPRVAETETLQNYCENEFPYYTSLTNWAFAVLLKEYLIDPNCLILVVPLQKPETDTEYLKPYPIVFNSPQVLDYVEDDYCVLAAGKKEDSKKWYVINDTTIQTYVMDGRRSLILQDEYTHGLGYIPVVKVRAQFKESFGQYSLFESRISSMLPRLDEAVREYSDQQANIVNHLFPERWEYASQSCQSCLNEQGVSTGQVRVATESGGKTKYTYKPCSACGGTGSASSSSPYSKFVVRPVNANLGETAAPIPPFGYVSKETAIIEAVDKRIEFHQFKALCSINMQFLMQTPLNQSGIAKEVDRDELNNFVYSVAEDMVCSIDEIYEIICDYRYMVIVPDLKARDAMRPKIAVPEKFDILSSTYLADEVKTAKESKLNAVITSALELDYTAKKFYNNPEVRDEMKCVIELDPLIGMSQEDKMVVLQNGGVTKDDYILSCNIVPFVKKATQLDKTFPSKPYEERMKIVRAYAKQIANAQKAAISGADGNPLGDSVGGLTGMIEIVKAVASGVYQLDAAVALVAQRFGLTEEEARRQIGTPAPLTQAKADVVSTVV